jgi:hypothetical protein
MSNKTLAGLGIVFAILAVVVALLVWGPSASDDSGGDADALRLDDYSASSTSKVSMGRAGTDPVVLTKIDGRWKVGAKNVNAEQIDELFKALAKIDDATLVSSNPDNHEKLGATAKLGTTLKLTSDGNTTTYIIGNGADTAGSFYVKREGSDKVYQVTSDLQAKLAQDAKTWQSAPVDTSNQTELPAGMEGLPGMPPGAQGAPVGP